MSADVPPVSGDEITDDSAGTAPEAAAATHSKEVILAPVGDGPARTLWLLGTAHVSRASVDEAVALIRAVRPTVVAIELCDARYAALTDPDRWKKLDIFKVFREGRSLFLLANLAIGAWQRRIGAELGVEPGAEMLAAAETAREVGARVELIDRDIQATLRRTWGTISFWQKFSLLGAIGQSLVLPDEVSQVDIEAMKQDGQLADMLVEFSRVLPDVAEPLIYERDRYMASGIDDLDAERIVAIVGAAHVPGMLTALGQHHDRAPMMVIPAAAGVGRVLRWLIPALVFVAIVLAWRKDQPELVGELVWIWIVANAIPAAILAAVAGAKPLSIVAAAVASPITSLNPMVGAAMVVGPVEAWLRKPTVADCERIAEDVQSLRGLYRNPFTRVLLVAVMASLGSAIGAWVAGFLMFRSLAGG
jgi:pheromone shutdown-related protein TraB